MNGPKHQNLKQKHFKETMNATFHFDGTWRSNFQKMKIITTPSKNDKFSD